MLPVGGIKEKVLAARRAGVETLIIPKENRKDVDEDIPANLRADIRFIYVDQVSQVLREALDTSARSR